MSFQHGVILIAKASRSYAVYLCSAIFRDEGQNVPGRHLMECEECRELIKGFERIALSICPRRRCERKTLSRESGGSEWKPSASQSAGKGKSRAERMKVKTGLRKILSVHVQLRG